MTERRSLSLSFDGRGNLKPQMNIMLLLLLLLIMMMTMMMIVVVMVTTTMMMMMMMMMMIKREFAVQRIKHLATNSPNLH